MYDFFTHTERVNPDYDRCTLKTLTEDQFKCLIFVFGLKSPQHKEIRKILCGERHVRKKINCPAFGKTCSICKRKNHAPKVCGYKKKKVRELKDTQVDRGGAEIFTLNTPTKNKSKNKWEIFPHASRYWLWHNTYSSELLAWFRKAEA